LGVGSRDAAPGYAVTNFEGSGNGVFTKCNNDACGFLTKGKGERGGIAALAEVNIDEVDAGGFDADKSFSGAGGRRREIAEDEGVGGAGSEDLNGLHGWLDASLYSFVVATLFSRIA
jgi:hypothetical protein